VSHYVEDDRMEIMPFRRDDGVWVWIVSRRFTFVFGDDLNRQVFTVPAGFETDLGSIPAWGRWMISPSDPGCAQAYVLHDYLNTITAKRRPGFGVLSSVAAAAVLYDAMRCNYVPVWKATTIHTAVLAGIASGER
jgi:hypothetical protein